MNLKQIVSESKIKSFGGICLQLFVSVAVSLSVMSDGLSVGWTSSTIGKLMDNSTALSMTLEQASLIGTLPGYFALLPIPLTIYSANKIGRKLTILWGNTFVILSWIILYFSNTMAFIYFGVILRGIGASEIYTIPMVYIAEIAQPSIRGFLCSFVPIMMNLGILLSYICSLYMSLRHLALLGAVLGLAMFSLSILAPKSPYFLFMDNKPELARKSLEKFRGSAKIDKELSDIKATIDREKQEKKGSILDVIQDYKTRKVFMIIIVVQVFQQLCGIDSVLIFLQVILDDADPYFSNEISSIIFASVKLASCTLALLLMDKVGRRPLLIVSCFATGLTLVVLGEYFYVKEVLGSDVSQVSWVPLALLLLYVLSYNVGLGSVTFVLGSEMLPTRYRALGTASVQIAYCISMVTTAHIFAWLKDTYGFYSAFWFLAICTFIGFLLAIFFVMETKGKSLKQIQLEIK